MMYACAHHLICCPGAQNSYGSSVRWNSMRHTEIKRREEREEIRKRERVEKGRKNLKQNIPAVSFTLS